LPFASNLPFNLPIIMLTLHPLMKEPIESQLLP
jgi:hypothetical protein